MANKNKVQYGLKNVHYAGVKYDELTGEPTYSKPIPWPGAIEMVLDPAGDLYKLKADNIDYYVNQNNQGYSGNFKSALIPDDFRIAHLGETLNSDGTISEYANSQSTPYALIFQFEGDVNATRYILYHCVSGRTTLGSVTKDGGEVNTSDLTVTASPRPHDELIKHKAEKGSTQYDNWFTQVQEPVGTSTEATGG